MQSQDQIFGLTDAPTSAVWQIVTQFSHHLIPPKNVDMVKMILMTYCWQMEVHDNNHSSRSGTKGRIRRQDGLQDDFPLSFSSKEQFTFHLRVMITKCTFIHCYTPPAAVPEAFNLKDVQMRNMHIPISRVCLRLLLSDLDTWPFMLLPHLWLHIDLIWGCTFLSVIFWWCPNMHLTQTALFPVVFMWWTLPDIFFFPVFGTEWMFNVILILL